MLNLLMKLTLSIAILVYHFGVNATCLKEGDEIVLSGVIKEELFYGPPNWGEDRNHDEKLLYWILHLDSPLKCVIDANTEQEGWDSNVQLIISGEDYKIKRSLLNHHVAVDGNVMLAVTGYHMTSVLLKNISFKQTKKIKKDDI
ncbi:DUF4431 domain-containing protein [Enterobacter hormaechei]|uniref:DUF4431 domain-containing protein n=1 Tax=Enterobacter hormaechei TaxID=158836 RepID=A0AAX3YWN0_9ENTR|nr:DUF4431 domain-containing protein [Enterobacter hormaechei]OIR52317.1 hypothetical protein BH712_01675 [Enterobacter hormaechei ATCC 49162]WMB09323.1 DUF4431 domain-containing protein [Enterobacter hormaechei]